MLFRGNHCSLQEKNGKICYKDGHRYFEKDRAAMSQELQTIINQEIEKIEEMQKAMETLLSHQPAPAVEPTRYPFGYTKQRRE